MKLYAETAGLRARQVLGDLAVVAWTAAWVWAGVTLYRLVEKLAVPGARVELADGRALTWYGPRIPAALASYRELLGVTS